MRTEGRADRQTDRQTDVTKLILAFRIRRSVQEYWRINSNISGGNATSPGQHFFVKYKKDKRAGQTAHSAA
jgi:hypothetical protein